MFESVQNYWIINFPAGLKYRSQVIVLPIQEVSQTLVKVNLRTN